MISGNLFIFRMNHIDSISGAFDQFRCNVSFDQYYMLKMNSCIYYSPCLIKSQLIYCISYDIRYSIPEREAVFAPRSHLVRTQNELLHLLRTVFNGNTMNILHLLVINSELYV